MRINVLQWLLIIATGVVCRYAGAPVLIPPLIAVVVGLHFLPLAAVFEEPRLRIPAALLGAAGATGVIVWLMNGPDETVRLLVGLISALSLWGMALWTIAGAASAAGQAPGSEQPVAPDGHFVRGAGQVRVRDLASSPSPKEAIRSMSS